MSKKIDGIRFVDGRKSLYSICTIEFFSDELKNLIKKQLSTICYGISKAESDRKSYSYKNTLKEFFKRYDEKTKKTKIGMMGELLTHVLLLYYFEKLCAVSPFFNTSDKNIKMGFDLVLYSENKKEIWITEVKSGCLYIKKDSNQMTSIFLNRAKADLLKRLNENECSLWENAINGAKIALDNNIDRKKVVEDILLDIEDEVSDENATSLDKNVILVSSLFSSPKNIVESRYIKDFRNRLNKKNSFKKEFIFSIQKETYYKIEDFLRNEIKS
ncbi:DUF1837 domain-containing protein [Halarcobacter ebronensis]|uniref:Phosphate ABC transporter substrate-binding protein n=1 Tax=Halarcobacter ebronensis TaxID=1462615 RepID=A0A4Q1AX51_9BACT|nr:DUF1837 domain-containing protein [Halarcobacter ebronensis]QKF82537.1 hypothetical protein AEBR_2058 [Halarcobacter ebronensis]RXK07446.1 phosphate ABC transporter substrate-binding protein [Halarcobacter ebronensis]